MPFKYTPNTPLAPPAEMTGRVVFASTDENEKLGEIDAVSGVPLIETTIGGDKFRFARTEYFGNNRFAHVYWLIPSNG